VRLSDLLWACPFLKWVFSYQPRACFVHLRSDLWVNLPDKEAGSAEASLREELRLLQLQLEEKFAIIQYLELSATPPALSRASAQPASSPCKGEEDGGDDSKEGGNGSNFVLLEMKFDLPFGEIDSNSAKQQEFKQQLIADLHAGFARLQAPGTVE
jgi:hypothetical protein